MTLLIIKVFVGSKKSLFNERVACGSRPTGCLPVLADNMALGIGLVSL